MIGATYSGVRLTNLVEGVPLASTAIRAAAILATASTWVKSSFFSNRFDASVLNFKFLPARRIVTES